MASSPPVPARTSAILLMLLRVALWSVVLAVAPAIAGVAAPSATTTRHCENSERGYPDLFCGEARYVSDGNATVFLKITDAAGGMPRFSCSGVVIGRRSVLTAAHCFAGCPARCEAVVGYGPSVLAAAALIPVLKISLFPRANSSSLSAGNDFALLTLAERDLHPAYRQAARILLARSFLEARPATLSVTGYGVYSPKDTTRFGKAYYIPVPVASYACTGAEEQATGCLPFREFILADRANDGEDRADTCGGDSGGPAMVQGRIPRILVGITSRALARGAQDCGTGGIYELVGTVPVLEWLVSLVPDLRIVTRW